MMRAVVAAIFLSLVFAGKVAWGQEDAVAPEAKAQERRTEDATEGNGQAAAEPEPDAPASDPFDYESSEQISEDLSVSFPVDI